MYSLTVILLAGSALTQLLVAIVLARQVRSIGRYRWEWGALMLAMVALFLGSAYQFEMVLGIGLYDFPMAAIGTVAALMLMLGLLGLRRLMDELRDQRAQLELLSTTDVLTGLGNRRHTFERAAQELLRAGRNGEPVALILLDIDHLRSINEKHGLAAGDAVLVAVADELRAGLRQIDVVGRIGGEEFVLFLPNTDRAAAAAIAERLRTRIEHLGIMLQRGERISVTATLGVVIGQGGGQEAAENFRDMLMQADTALNIAKERGQNAVTEWVPDMAIQAS